MLNRKTEAYGERNNVREKWRTDGRTAEVVVKIRWKLGGAELVEPGT